MIVSKLFIIDDGQRKIARWAVFDNKDNGGCCNPGCPSKAKGKAFCKPFATALQTAPDGSAGRCSGCLRAQFVTPKI